MTDRWSLAPTPELSKTVRDLYAIAFAEKDEPAIRWLGSYFYDVFGEDIEDVP